MFFMPNCSLLLFYFIYFKNVFGIEIEELVISTTLNFSCCFFFWFYFASARFWLALDRTEEIIKIQMDVTVMHVCWICSNNSTVCIFPFIQLFSIFIYFFSFYLFLCCGKLIFFPKTELKIYVYISVGCYDIVSA